MRWKINFLEALNGKKAFRNFASESFLWIYFERWSKLSWKWSEDLICTSHEELIRIFLNVNWKLWIKLWIHSLQKFPDFLKLISKLLLKCSQDTICIEFLFIVKFLLPTLCLIYFTICCLILVHIYVFLLRVFTSSMHALKGLTWKLLSFSSNENFHF